MHKYKTNAMYLMALRISKDTQKPTPKIPMIKKTHKCVFIKFKIIKLIELLKFVDVFLVLTANVTIVY